MVGLEIVGAGDFFGAGDLTLVTLFDFVGVAAGTGVFGVDGFGVETTGAVGALFAGLSYA